MFDGDSSDSSILNDVKLVKVDRWVEVGRWRRGRVILGTILDVISNLFFSHMTGKLIFTIESFNVDLNVIRNNNTAVTTVNVDLLLPSIYNLYRSLNSFSIKHVTSLTILSSLYLSILLPSVTIPTKSHHGFYLEHVPPPPFLPNIFHFFSPPNDLCDTRKFVCHVRVSKFESKFERRTSMEI